MNLPPAGNATDPSTRISLGLLVICILLGCHAPPSDPPKVATDRLDPAIAENLHRSLRTLQASPRSADAWGEYGKALHAAEFLGPACECYARAAQLDPHEARWPHLLGLLQLQDEPELALENLRRAVELAGATNDAPRLRLAQALLERGRDEDAKVQLTLLTNVNPAHPAARLEIARLQLRANAPADAALTLAPCLTNPFTARPALLLLSQVRAREGADSAAAALASRAASMPRPFDWPDRFLREVHDLRHDRTRRVDRVHGLMAQRRLAEASTELAELLRAFPGDPEVLLLAGRERLQQGDCGGAEARFREHLEGQPDSLNGLIQLALSLLCQERWSDASECLSRAVAIKPDFAEAHANLGLARARMGDHEGAIESYRMALRCSPGQAGSHAALADLLMQTGRLDEARVELDRALALDPRHPRAQAIRARLARP